METRHHPSTRTHQQRASQLSAAGRVTLLLGLVCAGVMLLQGFAGGQDLSGTVLTLTAAAVCGLVLLDMWLLRQFGERPPRTAALVTVIAHALAVEMVTLIDGLTYTSILYLTLPFPVFFMLGRQVGFAVSVGMLSWLTVKFFIFKPYWLQDPAAVNSYTLLVVSLILVTIMAQVVQSERVSRQHAEKLLADLNKSHRQLASYTQRVAELATVEERNRLARDIHDSLGHYLTVIGIQLEKAAVFLSDDPNETLVSIRNAKRMTDQALTDVRRSVGALREQQPLFVLQTALKQLVETFQVAPFEVNLSIEGDEKLFTYQQLMTLYRAAQEGLTNVHRHACAQHVRLEVSLNDVGAFLTLADDGIGMQDVQQATASVGLRGLHERLALIGGRLDIEGVPGRGTTLRVQIPRQEARS